MYNIFSYQSTNAFQHLTTLTAPSIRPFPSANIMFSLLITVLKPSCLQKNMGLLFADPLFLNGKPHNVSQKTRVFL